MLRLMALILLLGSPGQALPGSLPDVIDGIRGGIVGVGRAYPPRQPIPKGKNNMGFSGTGFAVANGRLVVTNAHVLPDDIDDDRNETLAVFSGRGAQNQVHRARVLKVDPEHDLALLEIGPPALPALQLGDSAAVREGQAIAITGFPIGLVLGLYPVTHRGIVSAITPMARPANDAGTLSAAQLRRMRNPFDAFQLDAVAYPGNSGSPVYDQASGRVIGVLNSVLVKESRESLLQRPSGISYAIPVKFVKELLRQVESGS